LRRQNCTCGISDAEAIVASMQGPNFRKATDAVFAMTPAKLGQIALDAARHQLDCPECRPGNPCAAHAAGSC
jgi:hypothetical protein